MSVTMLPDDKLGGLFKAVVEYTQTGITPDFIKNCDDVGIQMIFENFCIADDENFKKFKLRCIQNSKNRTGQKDPIGDD